MFPSLQPRRPQAPQPRSPPSIPHRQVRAVQVQQQPSTTVRSPRQPPSSLNSSASSSASPAEQHKPIPQIDAMPPITAPRPFTPSLYPSLPHLSSPRSPSYDPSTRHPVFFTQNLRKPPFPIRDGGFEGVSPVAFGYVVERGGDERESRDRGRL